jgi:hypothetical protein
MTATAVQPHVALAEHHEHAAQLVVCNWNNTRKILS